MSRTLGVPISFEVESFSLNHVALKDLRVGRGIRVSRLLIIFYPDALLLRRRLEDVKAVGVRINVPELNEDFGKGGGGKGGGEGKGEGTLPLFSVGRVTFLDLKVVPTDSLAISVRSGAFSYSMGGRSVKVSDIFLNVLKVSTVPGYLTERMVGDVMIRRDTLYARVSARGRYDSLAMALGDGRMVMWSSGDTLFTHYMIGSFDVEGPRTSLKVRGGDALWKASGGMGDVSFSARRVIWADTLDVEDITGRLILDSLPDFRLEGVRGRIYGGGFRFSLTSESLKVFRGDLVVRSISPTDAFTVSGRFIFSLDLRDTSFVGGGRLDYLRLKRPATELGGIDFSVESRGLRRYDFNALGNFTDVSGYYDLSKDEGEMTFDINKPVRSITYDRLHLYTFSAKGRARKEGNFIKVSLKSAKVWFLLYDTLRLDSLFAYDLNLEMDVRRPMEMRSEGRLEVFYSQLDTVRALLSYSYSPESFTFEGDVKASQYGSLRVVASGRVPDSLLISHLRYDRGILNVSLRDISLHYGDTILLRIPDNPLLGGRVEGNLGLVADSAGYTFLKGSVLSLKRINPTPLFATFLPDLDLLIDDMSLRASPEGSLENPEVSGGVSIHNLSYGDIQIDSVGALYRVSRDVLGVDSLLLWVGNSPVEVEVGRFYTPNRTLYVFARTEGFPTDRFLPFLLPDSSRLTFELAVSGKVDSPRVLGFLYWTARSIDLNGNFVKRPRLYAVAEGDRIVFPALKDTNVAHLGGGYVSFWGDFRTDLRIDSVLVRLKGAEVQADPDITAVLDGDLKITGDLKKEVMVSGDITAEEVEIFKPLTDMAAGGTSSATTRPVVLYDIHFYAPRRIFLNSTLSSQALTGALLEIDAELSADLNAQRLSPTLSSVSGTLTFLRGNVYIVDKVFRIDRGEIVLYGTGGTVNILSSATFPRVSGNGPPDSVKVFVSIEGEIDRPTVRIWSQPYMATGEILALIVGGGSVLGFLSRGLKWGLNLSELSIRQTPTSYQLLFGTYITRRIYLRSALSTTGDYNSIKTLYFVNPNFSIYGERIQEPEGTRYGVGINYRIRF